MATKPIFTRPIEIQDSTNYYRITYIRDGAGTYNVDINPGVYANIAALMEALETAGNTALIAGESCSVAWTLLENTTNKNVTPKVSFSVGDWKVTIGTELAKIMGDPGQTMDDDPYASTRTAPYSPSHVWIPRYECSLQERWRKVSEDMVDGIIVKTGQYVGNKTGTSLHYKKLAFTNELAKNIFDDASQTVVSGYDVDKDRNLSTFVEGAVSSSPSEAGNPSTRGVFYYPDWNDLIDNPEIVPGGTDGSTTSREGINYDIGTLPAIFTFCQFGANPLPSPKASAAHGKLYYDTKTFELHEIESMPNWQAPDQS